MKLSRPFRRLSWLGLTLAMLAAALPSQAQTTTHSLRAATQPQAPAPSPVGNPAGLTSRFPAGLPQPSNPNPNQLPTDGGAVPDRIVVYSRSNYEAQAAYTGSGRYTALQIAQSFITADADRDGQLTPTEAERLSILPYTFEDMDRNRDRILTRSEYEDSLRFGAGGR